MVEVVDGVVVVWGVGRGGGDGGVVVEVEKLMDLMVNFEEKGN